MHNANNAATMTCDTDALNSLLRGELSAVETYDQAMKKIEDPTVLTDLQRIRGEHSDAAVRLRDQVTRFGGTPSESSGPWGAFTAAVTATARTVEAATSDGIDQGLTPKRSDVIAQPTPSASGTPPARPAAESRQPSKSTIRTTSRRPAPMASRMPISRVRRAVWYAMTP